MSKAIDREVQARNKRVMRNKLYGKTVDVGAWKSHRDSWKENLERYTNVKDEMQKDYANWKDSVEKNNQWKVINNDILICNMQITICDNQIKIAKLIQENTKLKTNLM